jgi:hypothetical protein
MTIALEEIQERKEQLRQEILERECLLAALEVLHKHATASRGSKTIDTGTVFRALRQTVVSFGIRSSRIAPATPARALQAP